MTDNKKNIGIGALPIVGGIIGVIIFFVFFKKPPTGTFSSFGMPTLFLIGGYLVFALLGKLFKGK